MPASVRRNFFSSARRALLALTAGLALAVLPVAAHAQDRNPDQSQDAQKARPETSGLTATINDFANNTSGNGSLYSVMQASDGNFYIAGESGTEIVRVLPNSTDTSGTLSTLAGQLASACGTNIVSNLVEASDGNLYGMTRSGAANGYGAFFKYVLSTRTCTPVYAFNPIVDSSYPSSLYGGLTYGSDGNFYGEFSGGGTTSNGQVFQITPGGTYNQVYNFCSPSVSGCPDGQYPRQYLVEATDGNFYGVTNNGGSGANQGVFFQLVPGGTFPWVENPLFNISCSNGCDEFGYIVEGPDGDLYGAMDSGGANDGDGAIFQYDFQGDFVDFYDFPYAYQEPQTLFIGGDGNIYGQTLGYGCNCPGDFYQLTPGTGTYTDLSTFTASTFSSLGGPLVQASDGNFYGAANGGGTKSAGGMWQAVLSTPIAAPIQVSLSETTSAGTPVTVSWKVNNATSKTFRSCYLYSNPSQGGGTFTGKAVGTQDGAVLSGSAVVTPTSTGTYTYAVTCGGVETGISPTLTVTGLAAAATKTVLTESPNPVTVDSNASLTATVTRTNQSGTPGGSVQFEYEGLVLATKTLSNGTATYAANTTGIAPGTYGVYAVYVPDSTDSASTSNTVNVALKYPTATTLSVNPTTITVPASATIKVTVAQTVGTGTPGGTVTIYADGSPVISNYPLSGGSATITAPTTGFPSGTYSVTAGYNGSGSENVSTSSVVSVKLQ
jgi:uncharacterized repeat protein (TIGR03803 family)